MSRRKPVDSPGHTSLRRSSRLLSRNSLPESSKLERNLDRIPGKGHGSCLEQRRRKVGEVEREASNKRNIFSVGLANVVNSASFLEDSRIIGGFVDGSCTVRRSPRFSNGGNSSCARRYPLRVLNGEKSDGKTKDVTVCLSEKSSKENVPCRGKTSRRLCLTDCKNKKVLSEGGEGELSAPPRGRQGRKRSVIVADDKAKVSGISIELKRAKNRTSTACVHRSQDDNTVSSSGRNAEIIGRRITRSMSVGSIRKFSYKENDSMSENDEIFLSSCTEKRLKRDDTALSLLEAKTERKEGNIRLMNKVNEEERSKTNIVLNDHGHKDAIHGWTKDQEMALQRAYFTANPSPHFWKKVSKLVPGKSAQECFDKVHSDQITPRQPRPRSRVNKANLSPIQRFSLSASKLLKPTEPKTKRLNKRGQLAQKTIRRLLEKKCLVEQGNETDLFSVLEPSIGQKVQNTLSTPILKEGMFRSSRLVNESGGTIISPPVLKQVKNKALHEKYIDRLHCRDAKRKAESGRLHGKNVVKPADVQKKDLPGAAKDALVLNVKDAIDKLKSLHADSSGSSSDFSCDRWGSEEDDEVDL